MSRTHTIAIALALSAAGSTGGCGGPVPEPREPWEAAQPVPPERTVCGWEELGEQAPLRITAEGNEEASPGDAILAIAPAATAPYGRVQAALKPAESSLVRVKLVLEDRWLLPTTYPQKRRQPKLPPPKHRATRVVGKRQISRDVRRPAERFAALRIHGDQVVLFVENEAQAGTELALDALRGALSALEPSPQVFAVTATEDTAWSRVQTVVIAAACYDRGPGDEPHEVILD